MRALLAIGCVLIASGCVAAKYASDLDACVLNNVGNPAAIAACQCAVSQAAGRDCSWLDGGPGGPLVEGGAQ